MYDRLQGFEAHLSWELANWDQFSVGKWFAERCAVNLGDKYPYDVAHFWMETQDWRKTTSIKRDKYAFVDREITCPSDGAHKDDEPDSDDGGVRPLASSSLAVGGIQVD